MIEVKGDSLTVGTQAARLDSHVDLLEAGRGVSPPSQVGEESSGL